MKKILVLCNTANPDSPNHDYDETLPVNPNPPNQNLNLHVDGPTYRILEGFNPLAHDLLEIASYIYYADCSIQRGSTFDVFAARWRRRLDFVIPVSAPDFWNQPEVKNLLIETLEFLTDDQFSFNFTPPQPRGQLFLEFDNNPFPGADSISLFSGGLDSLIGCIYLIKELHLHPLLVSHRSIARTESRQRDLLKLLRDRNPGADFPHLSMWVNRMGNPAKEETQRSRSFLYLSTAAATASQLDIRKIYICENGVVSLNIPISNQNIGTMLTRSTHPKFLILFEKLINLIFSSEITLNNPFIFQTKTEMLSMLHKWGQSDLIQGTISCSYTSRRTRLQPQCGTCSQCVGRRFSVISAGLERFDKPEYYEKDIFLDHLNEGRETVFSEGYVRSAFEIYNMDDIQFFARYPELNASLGSLNMPAEECGEKLYKLFRTHSNEVIGVTLAKFKEHSEDLLVGKLPENCLISMLGKGHHLLNPLEEYANKISAILSRALRLDFQNEKPKDEARVQEASQAALAAAGEKLIRESPELAYGIVRTRPDFSDEIDYKRYLFIELKLLNSRPKLNKIITEITSRITIYRDQGAVVLFVVYDTGGFIADVEEFVRPLEKHEGVKAAVIR